MLRDSSLAGLGWCGPISRGLGLDGLILSGPGLRKSASGVFVPCGSGLRGVVQRRLGLCGSPSVLGLGSGGLTPDGLSVRRPGQHGQDHGWEVRREADPPQPGVPMPHCGGPS